ncbi:hypothetical protein [Plantibacter sp. M259]|uniref:hypothetical protein n=1 Tax=Plantibacter sp. M259 TaxID=2583822 RepID=UPI001110EC32|nr:hypothetical protein [Plantibacter sp. M259]
MGNWTREDPGLFDAGSLGTAATGLQTVETALGEARTAATNAQAGVTPDVWGGDASTTWIASLDTPAATIDAVTTALSAARTAIGAYSETVSGIATRATSVKQTMFESNQVINRQYADPAGGPTPEQAQHRQLQEQAAMGDLTLARNALEGLADERTLADSTLVLALTPPNATAWEAQRQALAAIGITDSGSLTPTAVAQAMAELGNQIASGDYSEADVSNLQTLYDLYGKNPQVMAQMNLAMGGENVVSLIDELGRGAFDGSIPAAAALALAQSVRGGLSVGSERWSPLTGQSFAEEMMANASTGVGGDPAAIGFLFGDPTNAPIGVTTTLALADMIDQEERGNYHIWQDGSPMPGGTTLALLEEEQTGLSGLRVVDLAGRVLDTLGQYPDEALEWLTSTEADGVTGEGTLGENRVDYWYGERDWSTYDQFEGPAGLWAGAQNATGGPADGSGAYSPEVWGRAATLTHDVMNALAGNDQFITENVSEIASVKMVAALTPQIPGFVEDPLNAEGDDGGSTLVSQVFGAGDPREYARVSKSVLAEIFGAVGDHAAGAEALRDVVSNYQVALTEAASAENASVPGLTQRVVVLQGLLDGAADGAALGEATRQDEAIEAALGMLSDAIGLIPVPGLGGAADIAQGYVLGQLIGAAEAHDVAAFADNHATLAEELGGEAADNRMAVRIMVSQIVWESQRPEGVPDPTGLDAEALEDWFTTNETKLDAALDSQDGGFTADTFASRYRDAYRGAGGAEDPE